MIYTFYSYKGGVGRSMALANIAEFLYRKGLRVLMIDFDLEAPGLEQYFYEKGDPSLQQVQAQRGVIDMLLSYKELRSLPSLLPKEEQKPLAALASAADSRAARAGCSNLTDDETPFDSDEVAQLDPLASADCEMDAPRDGSRGAGKDAAGAEFAFPVEPLKNFIQPIYQATSLEGGELSLVTAGRRARPERSRETGPSKARDEFGLYADRVRAFAWDDFYLNWDGELFFDWFRVEVGKAADVVLIDSRTGVAEMSGVCTYQLADTVVMFLAPNNQNIDGTQKIADSLTTPQLIKEGRKGRDLSLVFVPSRVDLGDKNTLDDLAGRFRAAVSRLLSPKLLFETDAFVDLKIPYVPYYSFVEEIAIRDSDSPAAIELRKAYEKICQTFAQLEPPGSKLHSKLAERANFKPNLAERQNRLSERAFTRLSPEDQAVAPAILTRLVRLAQPGEDERDMPRRVKLSDLPSEHVAAARALAEAKLVAIGDHADGGDTLTLSDEGLLTNWERLKSWVERNREFLLWRQNLQKSVREWEENRRENIHLLRGTRYAEAQKWFRNHSGELNDAERLFVTNSLELPAREWRRRLSLVAAVVAVLSILGVAILIWQTRPDKEAQQTARSRELATLSKAVVKPQPELSLLFAIEAARASETNEALDALRSSLVEYARTVMKVHEGGVTSATFSADGSSILTASKGEHPEARVWRWSLTDPWQDLLVLRGHEGPITSAVYSPDGKSIMTASWDSTAIIWDATTGAQLKKLSADPRPSLGSLSEAVFSPDGTLAALACMANRVEVWNVQTGKLVALLTAGLRDNVNGVAFSPDGRFLVSAGNQPEVRVWAVNGWKEVGRLPGHGDAVLRARFSPDGSYVASASADGTARVWRWGGEAGSVMSIAVLRGHTGPVVSVAFSPDGKQVITGSADNTVRVWEAMSGKLLATYRADSPVNDATFGPDGKLIITASDDGTVRLWDVPLAGAGGGTLQELLQTACLRVMRNMTPEEWSQYMGAEPYHKTCPGLQPASNASD